MLKSIDLPMELINKGIPPFCCIKYVTGLAGMIVIVNFVCCCQKLNHKMRSTLLSSLSGIYLNICEI